MAIDECQGDLNEAAIYLFNWQELVMDDFYKKLNEGRPISEILDKWSPLVVNQQRITALFLKFGDLDELLSLYHSHSELLRENPHNELLRGTKTKYRGLLDAVLQVMEYEIESAKKQCGFQDSTSIEIQIDAL